MSQFTSHSPPPLRHPVPTHPAYIPEPPSTPASPQGYQRFSSSPAPPIGHGGPNILGPGVGQQHMGGMHGGAGGFGQSNLVGHGMGPGQGGYGGGGAPAYTTPFQHSQGAGGYGGNVGGGNFMQSGPAPGQGQGPAPSQGQFGGAGWSFDGATTQLGLQLGQNAVAAGQEYVQRNFGTILPSSNLKHHFNVSNMYVMKKIQLVLFPWRHKPWSRKPRGQGEWLPPREDINSPDLYIPVMAMVTYILIGSLYAGLYASFHPEILGVLASRALAVVFIDFAVVKLGCYILNIQGSSQVVDLVAYGGYKFVGVILAIAASILDFKGTLWALIFIYVFLANAFFLLRSLRAVVLPDASNTPASQAAATVTPATRRRRITFLFLEAVSQVFYMWWLVRIS